MTMSLMHQWHDTICGGVIRSIWMHPRSIHVLVICYVHSVVLLPFYYYIYSLSVSSAAFSFLAAGYNYHPLHVISYPLDHIREELSFTKEPEAILDRQDRCDLLLSSLGILVLVILHLDSLRSGEEGVISCLCVLSLRYVFVKLYLLLKSLPELFALVMKGAYGCILGTLFRSVQFLSWSEMLQSWETKILSVPLEISPDPTTKATGTPLNSPKVMMWYLSDPTPFGWCKTDALSTKDRQTPNDILMFQQHQGESLSEAWTRFKDLLQKVPHHGIDRWLLIQIFYDHVSFCLKREIDHVVGGKLRDKNTDESWDIIENLTLYDHKGWSYLNDSINTVKSISTPQPTLKTPDRRILELEDQLKLLLKDPQSARTSPTAIRRMHIRGIHHDNHSKRPIEPPMQDTFTFRKRTTIPPQLKSLEPTFEARMRDYMASQNERMEKFKNIVLKQREMIDNKMTGVLGLIKELTESKAPKKVLI
ncbi:hypothetical protein Tco_0427689 [Tanacetum coccineum]